MTDHHESGWSGFLRSRAGVVLLAFLAAAGFLLAYEHRAHILAGDGPLFILLAACVVMHLFMHHGHGGGGDDDGDDRGAGGGREGDF